MIGHQCLKTICKINKEKIKWITESQYLKTLEWLYLSLSVYKQTLYHDPECTEVDLKCTEILQKRQILTGKAKL